jgi:hypothetical protein
VLILAGGAAALVLSALAGAGALVMKTMRSADRNRPDKIPI